MRRIIIFAMILTFIFAMVGCTAHNEPGKNAVVSLSSNAVFDVMQAEDLSEKTEDETVEKSTFAEETTQSSATKISTEKLTEEPIFSQTTTANTEPKQDTHTQTEPPKSEKSELEITTNTVSEVITAVEQSEELDISYWISYAQNYALVIGLTLDGTAIECWDNPISANANNKNIGVDIESRLNRYKNIEYITSVWIWAEKLSDTQYEFYIGYT